VDCIYPSERTLYIHPDECVGCGPCEPVCPVEATFYGDDLSCEMARLRRGQRAVLHRDAARPQGADWLSGRCGPSCRHRPITRS
jgi:ferredoxin